LFFLISAIIYDVVCLDINFYIKHPKKAIQKYDNPILSYYELTYRINSLNLSLSMYFMVDI